MTDELRREVNRQLDELFQPEPNRMSNDGSELAPGQNKILTMCAMQDEHDRKERARLWRIIHNNQCTDEGNFSAVDFGVGDD